ncbi:MAG: hypothetical protein WBG19_01665 [Thermoplasmata archaeon]
MDPQAKNLANVAEFLNYPMTMLQYFCLAAGIGVVWWLVDRQAKHSIQISELQVKLAMRQAEIGRDVEILKEKMA